MFGTQGGSATYCPAHVAQRARSRGHCTVCGGDRTNEVSVITAGGQEIRRDVVRIHCPNHCTHDEIEAAERRRDDLDA